MVELWFTISGAETIVQTSNHFRPGLECFLDQAVLARTTMLLILMAIKLVSHTLVAIVPAGLARGVHLWLVPLL